MALTRTADEVISTALSRIGVTEAGQDISAEDMVLGRRRFEETLAYLTARRVLYIGDPQAIPVAFVPDLSAMLALQLMGDFPPDAEAVSRLPTMSQVEASLRSLQSVSGSSRPVRAQYF